MPRYWVLFIAIGTLLSSAVAQNSLALVGSATGPATFRTGAKLVLVPVTVMDRKGAMVNGLQPGAFSVLEDKVVQHIASFSEQDAPVSIGIIFDVSGSMKSVLNEASSALRAFFDTANPEDEAFLYTVSTLPEKHSGFTRDYESFLSRMLLLQAQGSTALIDTIYSGLNEIRSAAHARKALLIISDGMDNHSRYSKGELMTCALESDAQIYAISIYRPPLTKKPIELREEQQGLLFLEELTRRTGGLQFVIRGGADLKQATASIGQALRNQYLIGYVPRSSDRSAKWHSIQVKLNSRDAKAYARTGYRSDE